MNPVCEDIKDLLVGEGVGVFASTKPNEWSIQVGDEPDSPSRTITIYDTPSTADKTFDSDRHFHHSSFQVRVRGKKYLSAHAKCEECRRTLDRYTTKVDGPKVALSFGDMRYDNITMDNEPLPLGQDSKGRFIFVVNGTAFRQRKESSEE